MPAPFITLTTDFGLGSPYVAAMKGVVLASNAAAQLVDLTHSLPPQDVRACSFFLCSAVPHFPGGTLHIVVVDSGVGTDRALLHVETGGQRLLVPDNGCWTELARSYSEPPKVRLLIERRFWRREVSATFHGRDILAPVAAHLSLGIRPEEFGPQAPGWVDYRWPSFRLTSDVLEGEVLFVDDFGNLITNLPGGVFNQCRQRVSGLSVGGQLVDARLTHTYGDAALGELAVLISSHGTVEIAEVCGNAAKRLAAGAGAAVQLVLKG